MTIRNVPLIKFSEASEQIKPALIEIDDSYEFGFLAVCFQNNETKALPFHDLRHSGNQLLVLKCLNMIVPENKQRLYHVEIDIVRAVTGYYRDIKLRKTEWERHMDYENLCISISELMAGGQKLFPGYLCITEKLEYVWVSKYLIEYPTFKHKLVMI